MRHISDRLDSRANSGTPNSGSGHGPPEIQKPFLSILVLRGLLHGIISLLIGAADVALMLVAVIIVADAIGIRYLKTARQS